MPNLPQHSYEEIRDVVVEVLLERDPSVNQFSLVLERVALRLEQRHPIPQRQVGVIDCLHEDDKALALEVFWDLFRQGAITLGTDAQWNTGWPWFRLSRFGATALARRNPYRFHDTSSYLSLVKGVVPDLLQEADLYLEEACAAFYADCLLASTVMLGVAAEAEFLRLIDVATASTTYGSSFSPVAKEKFIRSKIVEFQKRLRPHLKVLPTDCTEDFDTNLSAIQSVLRIARNDAGHPSGAAPPSREQAYVNLQLFVPFARQLMRLRKALF
jgi:hypothetical protein